MIHLGLLLVLLFSSAHAMEKKKKKFHSKKSKKIYVPKGSFNSPQNYNDQSNLFESGYPAFQDPNTGYWYDAYGYYCPMPVPGQPVSYDEYGNAYDIYGNLCSGNYYFNSNNNNNTLDPYSFAASYIEGATRKNDLEETELIKQIEVFNNPTYLQKNINSVEKTGVLLHLNTLFGQQRKKNPEFAARIRALQGMILFGMGRAFEGKTRIRQALDLASFDDSLKFEKILSIETGGSSNEKISKELIFGSSKKIIEDELGNKEELVENESEKDQESIQNNEDDSNNKKEENQISNDKNESVLKEQSKNRDEAPQKEQEQKLNQEQIENEKNESKEFEQAENSEQLNDVDSKKSKSNQNIIKKSKQNKNKKKEKNTDKKSTVPKLDESKKIEFLIEEPTDEDFISEEKQTHNSTNLSSQNNTSQSNVVKNQNSNQNLKEKSKKKKKNQKKKPEPEKKETSLENQFKQAKWQLSSEKKKQLGIETIEKIAKAEDPLSQDASILLAELYDPGKPKKYSVSKDIKKACSWYRRFLEKNKTNVKIVEDGYICAFTAGDMEFVEQLENDLGKAAKNKTIKLLRGLFKLQNNKIDQAYLLLMGQVASGEELPLLPGEIYESLYKWSENSNALKYDQQSKDSEQVVSKKRYLQYVLERMFYQGSLESDLQNLSKTIETDSLKKIVNLADNGVVEAAHYISSLEILNKFTRRKYLHIAYANKNKLPKKLAQKISEAIEKEGNAGNFDDLFAMAHMAYKEGELDSWLKNKEKLTKILYCEPAFISKSLKLEKAFLNKLEKSNSSLAGFLVGGALIRNSFEGFKSEEACDEMLEKLKKSLEFELPERFRKNVKTAIASTCFSKFQFLKKRGANCDKYFESIVNDLLQMSDEFSQKVLLKILGSEPSKLGQDKELHRKFFKLVDKFKDSDEGFWIQVVLSAYYANQGKLKKMSEIIEKSKKMLIYKIDTDFQNSVQITQALSERIRDRSRKLKEDEKDIGAKIVVNGNSDIQTNNIEKILHEEEMVQDEHQRAERMFTFAFNAFNEGKVLIAAEIVCGAAEYNNLLKYLECNYEKFGSNFETMMKGFESSKDEKVLKYYKKIAAIQKDIQEKFPISEIRKISSVWCKCSDLYDQLVDMKKDEDASGNFKELVRKARVLIPLLDKALNMEDYTPENIRFSDEKLVDNIFQVLYMNILRNSSHVKKLLGLLSFELTYKDTN